MPTLPSLPPWEGAHPIIVHFPVALFLIAPALVLVAMLSRTHRVAWMAATTLVLSLAALGAFLATWSGDATEHAVSVPQNVEALIHDHEEAGELARNLMLGVWVFASLTTAAVWKIEKLRRLAVPALALLLVLHAGASLTLVDAAHQGGQLVHVHGVLAPVGGSAAATSAPSATINAQPAATPSAAGEGEHDAD